MKYKYAHLLLEPFSKNSLKQSIRGIDLSFCILEKKGFGPALAFSPQAS